MPLAIEEAGLPRVLHASAGGAIGKLMGKRGLFYELVGSDIRAIDCPTEYSVYPANVSGKLAPKDPDQVAAGLPAAIRQRVPEAYRDTFGGTVVMTPTTSVATSSARTHPVPRSATRRCSPTTRSARVRSRPPWRSSSSATDVRSSDAVRT